MAGLIPPDKLEQIRAASDIVDIIGGYLGQLKKSGANFTALCPFHREKSPSFNVNPQRQTYHCFGCQKGGDVFGFVRDYENIPFTEAVRRLAERAKIPLEFTTTPGQAKNQLIKEKLLDVHEQITQRWQAALSNDAQAQIARDYLAKRGVSEEAIKLFRLGYAPDAWDDTLNWSKSRHYDVELMEEAGLVQKKDHGGHYDRFRGRLMFPICDELGRVVAFSGRVLSGDEKTAKYINSKETPIFTKGKVFFGLDKSKRALLDAKAAIICEGQLDLIAIFMSGVKNVVAPQGTAFTENHARILKRYVEEVILCFDSDNAGQNAAVRSLDVLLPVGLAIRVAIVPAPHDPDSFIKEFGGEAFAELIKNGEPFFDFFLKRLCVQHDPRSDRGRAAIVKAMGENLLKTQSEVMLDAYARKTAMALAVNADSVRTEFKKSTVKPAPRTWDDPVEEVPEETEAVAAPPPAGELQLLKILLQNESLLGWTEARLQFEWITHEGVRYLLGELLHRHAQGEALNPAAWLEEIEEENWRRLLTETLVSEQTRIEDEVTLQGRFGTAGLLERLRNKFIDQKLLILTGNPGITIADLDLIKALKDQKRQPLV